MDDTEQKAAINYELLVEDALRTVVRGSLALVEHEGLPGESHFYITFQTTAEGVQMSETLKAANPNEMTIVLQHQFWDLHVSESHFSVTLSFSGVHHNLNIPFAAVTHFNDPSVGFGLQFSAPEVLDALPEEEDSAPAADKKIAQRIKISPRPLCHQTAQTWLPFMAGKIMVTGQKSSLLTVFAKTLPQRNKSFHNCLALSCQAFFYNAQNAQIRGMTDGGFRL